MVLTWDVHGQRARPWCQRDQPIAFGHWSQLGLRVRPNLLSLDTGCVWGGCLSACRWHADAAQREIIQVQCAQAQVPGAAA